MEEIKVGEYVRTDNGIIGKYVKFRGFEDSIETNNKWIGFDIEKDIVKHSPNIIDLIECGDYVNGSRVIDIAQASVRAVYTEDATQKMALIPKINEDIKSIVTKEQFEQMKYIVGDE